MNSAFILENGNLVYDPSKPFLSSDLAIVNYEVVVAPTPSPGLTASSAGGWGGGFMKTHEPGMRRRRKGSAPTLKSFIEKVSIDVATSTMEGLKHSTHADPLEVTKELSPERLLEKTIRTLRERITKLEAWIRTLKSTQTGQLEALQAELEQTQLLAAALLGRLEAADRRLAGLQAPITVNLTLAAPPEPKVSGWAVLAGAGVTLAAVEYLIPPREKAWKEAGRGFAGILALYGLYRILQ